MIPADRGDPVGIELRRTCHSPVRHSITSAHRGSELSKFDTAILSCPFHLCQCRCSSFQLCGAPSPSIFIRKEGQHHHAENPQIPAPGIPRERRCARLRFRRGSPANMAHRAERPRSTSLAPSQRLPGYLRASRPSGVFGEPSPATKKRMLLLGVPKSSAQ